MSSESPAQAPEHRSQALSPVSPKPIHYPSQGGIPVLENQMDPIFNDTSNHPRSPPREDQKPAGQLASPPAQSEEPDAGGTAMTSQDATTAQKQAEDSDGSEYSPAFDSKNAIAMPGDASENAATSISLSTVAPAEPRAESHTSTSLTDDTATAQDTSYHASASGGEAPTSPPVPNPPFDIQALLDNIIASTPASGAQSTAPLDIAQGQTNVVDGDIASAPSALGGAADVMAQDSTPADSANSNGLPARPPTQQESTPAAAPQLPSADAFALPPNPNAGAPGTAPAPSGAGAPGTVPYGSAQNTSEQDPRNVDENTPWGPEIQKAYDDFLAAERDYVADGQWERFPPGSRLFIGNLSSERVTKRDLFHVFHKHGKLAQISIKQAYGFVQFLTMEECQTALRTEEGVAIRGRKIHLEISKPQKNAKGGGRRRSRSPDHGRGNNNNSGRQDNHRGGNRRDGGRDGHRSNSRNAYRTRSPDRYNGRRHAQDSGGGRRYSNPEDDGLPLPRRAPHEVPDLQIIAKDEPDNAFLRYVEQSFTNRGVRANTLMLSPRLDESAVIRRQILEGVLAVMSLTRLNLSSQKFSLSLFDRSTGQHNVKFEEYQGLDLNICVELVARAQTTHRAPPSYSQYGLPVTPIQQQQQQQHPQYPPQMPSFPQSVQQPPYPGPPAAQYPASGPANMDPASLSSLLGSLQQPNPGRGPQQHYVQQQAGYMGQPYGVAPQSQQQHQGQGGPDVQNIMAQLARYGS